MKQVSTGLHRQPTRAVAWHLRLEQPPAWGIMMLSDHHLGNFKNWTCTCEMSTYWSNRILTLGLRALPQAASLTPPCQGFSDAHPPQLAPSPDPAEDCHCALFFLFLEESEHSCGRCWHGYICYPIGSPIGSGWCKAVVVCPGTGSTKGHSWATQQGWLYGSPLSPLCYSSCREATFHGGDLAMVG